MKLTVAAFEAIYQTCDPEQRRRVFRKVTEQQPPKGLVVIAVPVSKVEAMVTGKTCTGVGLMSQADGAWGLP